MITDSIILNEREAKEARKLASEIDDALSSEQTFASLVTGLPTQAIAGFNRALTIEKQELLRSLQAYDSTKSGDDKLLKQKAEDNPGLALIVARIANQMTQKDLARRLGLKEQQIQRYEADRYRSISLANFQKVASVLGLKWSIKVDEWGVGSGWNLVKEVPTQTVKKILKHARKNKWFDDKNQSTEEEGADYLKRYVVEHIIEYSTPSLLRTGLNVEHLGDDFKLLAWKARVTRLAENIIEKDKPKYDPLNISWLPDLVKLSCFNDGPKQARELLLSKGIVLITESQIEGMKVDGAAFLVGKNPVIGLTLRRDTIDNFWFTLLHEIAHVTLHYREGLSAGFFDDINESQIEGLEKEADIFASNLLIPNETWKRTPARIAKSASVIEKFAKNQGIHPAIVFGRIQKERNNYKVFSNKIGRGLVRKQLFVDIEGELKNE